jgi:hypothetical protein
MGKRVPRRLPRLHRVPVPMLKRERIAGVYVAGRDVTAPAPSGFGCAQRILLGARGA